MKAEADWRLKPQGEWVREQLTKMTEGSRPAIISKPWYRRLNDWLKGK